MEDQSPRIVDWLLANADRYDLRAERRPWPERLGLPLTDFKVRAVLEGRAFDGRGTDRNANVSLIKGFSEVLERFIVCRAPLKNSNGLAVHEFEAEAKINARRELLERDAFYRFFYNKYETGFRLDDAYLLFRGETKRNSKVDQLLLKIAEYTLDNQVLNVVLHVGFAEVGNCFAVTIGLGASENLFEACGSAQIETWRNLSALMEEIPRDGLSVMEFRNRGNSWGPLDHLRLGSNSDYAKQINEYFKIKSGQRFITRKVKYIEYESYTNLIPSGCPLVATKAVSPEVIEFHFGLCPPEVRAVFSEDVFYDLPHPLA